MKNKVFDKGVLKKSTAAVMMLLFMTMLLCAPVWADNLIDEDKGEGVVLQLYSQNESTSASFNAVNLFPGDKVNKSYNIKVSHKEDIEIFFISDIKEGSGKLAEVLKIDVKIAGEVIYDGLMKDLPELEYLMPQDENEIVFDIEVYLDKSVGNEYMNQALSADFRWWVEDEEALSPKTGDSSNILCYIAMIIALSVVIILLIKRKKEECNG